MQDFWVQLGNYGFPILLSIYLLMRMETKLDQLNQTMTELKEAIYGLKP